MYVISSWVCGFRCEESIEVYGSDWISYEIEDIGREGKEKCERVIWLSYSIETENFHLEIMNSDGKQREKLWNSY